MPFCDLYSNSLFMIFVILIPEHFQATLISKDDNCIEGSLGCKLDGLGVILNDLLSSNLHSESLPSPAQNPFLLYQIYQDQL